MPPSISLSLPCTILLWLCCDSPPPAWLNAVLKLPMDLVEPDECAAKRKIKQLSKDKLHYTLLCMSFPIPPWLFKNTGKNVFLLHHSSRKEQQEEKEWRRLTGDRWKKTYGSQGRKGGLVGIWQSTQTPIHLVCPLSSTAQGDGLAAVEKVRRGCVDGSIRLSRNFRRMHRNFSGVCISNVSFCTYAPPKKCGEFKFSNKDGCWY